MRKVFKRRQKIWYVTIGIAVLLVALFSSIFGFTDRLSITTSSPLSQEGLAFIGVFHGLPKRLNDVKFLGNQIENQKKTWVYFRRDFRFPLYLPCKLIASDTCWMRANCQLSEPVFIHKVSFWQQLIQKISGSRRPTISAPEPQYYRIELPQQYSPNFRNCEIRFNEDRGMTRSWKLEGMPEPDKVIKDSEPNVLEGKALGTRFTLKEPVVSVSMSGDPNSPGSSFYHHATIELQNPPTDGADRFEFESQRERQTWNYPSPSPNTTELYNPAELLVEFGLGENLPTQRLAFSITLRRYRFYDETVVLNDVQFERKQENNWYVTGCSNRRVTTKSGITFTVDYSRIHSFSSGRSFGLFVRFDEPVESVSAPNSPYAKSVVKPIQVVDPQSGYLRKGKTAFWILPICFDTSKPTAKLAHLKVTIRQKVILGEETMHFLSPVNQAPNGGAPVPAK